MNKIKLVVGASLLALSGAASAASVTANITGGNWISQFINGNNPSTSVEADLRDNGETQDGALTVVGPPPPFSQGTTTWYDASFNAWDPSAIGNEMDGTYGGTITYDDVTGVVTGGSLVVSGSIGGAQIVIPGTGGFLNSWWAYEYVDVTVDLATGAASSAADFCYETYLGPASCVAAALPASTMFLGDTAMTYIGGVLTLEGGAGLDSRINEFELTTSVVPVPAAVWLFGSALGLLGWGRRKA